MITTICIHLIILLGPRVNESSKVYMCTLKEVGVNIKHDSISNYTL